jgi:hypothetical protein
MFVLMDNPSEKPFAIDAKDNKKVEGAKATETEDSVFFVYQGANSRARLAAPCSSTPHAWPVGCVGGYGVSLAYGQDVREYAMRHGRGGPDAQTHDSKKNRHTKHALVHSLARAASAEYAWCRELPGMLAVVPALTKRVFSGHPTLPPPSSWLPWFVSDGHGAPWLAETYPLSSQEDKADEKEVGSVLEVLEDYFLGLHATGEGP